MHYPTTSFLATVLASAAMAQYTIQPDSVDIADRRQWCQSQVSSCPLICEQIASGEPQTNECDPEFLTYGCVCSNGATPNISEYTLTIPYYTCVEWGNQCVKACGQDNACSNSCREDNPCGAQNPEQVNATTATSSATESATATPTDEAPGTIHTNALDNNNNNAAVRLGSAYGSTAVAAVLFAGFAMLF